MHGSTMIYLFVTPMAIALAIYLVPLQIGAARISPARGWRSPASGSGSCGGLMMQSGWLTADGAGPRRLVRLRAAVERRRTRPASGRTCGSSA